MIDLVRRLLVHGSRTKLEAADEIERLQEELAMLKRAKFCDEETIAKQEDEIEGLRYSVKEEAEIGRLLRDEVNQAPDEVLAHDNSQLRAEIERLQAELKKVREAWYGRCIVIDERDAEIERLRSVKTAHQP